jgi:hypothetical protein
MPRKVRGPNNFLKKSFVEFLEEGGRNSSWRGQKSVKMKKWRGINEKN